MVRAKFVCTSILAPGWKGAEGRQVNFVAVYGQVWLGSLSRSAERVA